MSLARSIKKLRELNESVPIPLRLPTEAVVAEAESKLAVTFTPDYRHFLLHGSDVVYGTFEPGIVTPDAGHLDLVHMVQEAWKSGVPKDYLPFCEDNGDFYCFAKDGRIVFWSHDGLSSEEWPGLGDWIEEVWIEDE